MWVLMLLFRELYDKQLWDMHHDLARKYDDTVRELRSDLTRERESSATATQQ